MIMLSQKFINERKKRKLNELLFAVCGLIFFVLSIVHIAPSRESWTSFEAI